MKIIFIILLLLSSVSNAAGRNNDPTTNGNVQVKPVGMAQTYLLVDLGNNNGGATTKVSQFSIAPRVSYELLFSEHFGMVFDLCYFHIFPTELKDKISFNGNDYNISAMISAAGLFSTMAGFKVYF